MTRLGESVLSDVELVAIVLGSSGLSSKDVLGLSLDLLARFGCLEELEAADINELMLVPGVGLAKAARLKAALELGRRAASRIPPLKTTIQDPSDIATWFRASLGYLSQEVFWVLGLDTRNRLIRAIQMAQGHLSGVEVHPREVFKPLVRMGAASAILVHNHPSGDPRPSREDLELTERLSAVGRLVGISILDHVVVGRQGFVSVKGHIEGNKESGEKLGVGT